MSMFEFNYLKALDFSGKVGLEFVFDGRDLLCQVCLEYLLNILGLNLSSSLGKD